MEHRDFPMPERRRFGSTDIMVPELSFGASGLGLVKEGSAEEEEAVAAVRNALRCGVNYFDTAPWYGQGRSEEVLGKALQGLSRDAFYAATKVGRYEPECDRMFDFSGSRTLESVRESLEKMKLTYFDVVQVHDVEFAPSVDVIVNETLPALESLRCAGIIRYIGITGYPLHVLREVLQKSSIRVDTVLSYCRGTLFDDSLADYLPFFQSMGLGVANAAPLGMGLLTSSPPPAWHPAAEDLKKACAEAAQFCKEAGYSIERLALQYSLTKFPGVHTTIVGIASTEVLHKNISCLSTVRKEEENIVHDLKAKFFRKPTSSHWEGVEVGKIRRKLAQRRSQLAPQEPCLSAE
ncbi:uncharacterized protein [Dermacentor andersoni]|uniref:uncharacterized protein isoform X2 n=1 Tax=Dermacentor andersoni TaxID=34620 RepID=UPI0021559179|nr:uncharacterized protein LOC126540229 isoform X2 [Dermacentor andersoni]